MLIVALLLSSPALWSGFVTGTMGTTNALIRFLIAIPVAALMLMLLRAVTASYGKRSTKQPAAADQAGPGHRAGQSVR